VLRRDRAPHAEFLPQERVVGGRVEARVEHHVVDRHRGDEFRHQPVELVDVRRRPLGAHGRQDRVRRATDGDHEFAEPLVTHPLFRPFLVLLFVLILLVVASPDVVAAGVAGVESGRVAGRVPHARAVAAEHASHGPVEQLAEVTHRQQAARGLVERGEVRDRLGAGEPDRRAQLGRVAQQGRDAAVVLALVLLEDEAGEELMLGELPRAERARVGGEAGLGGRVGLLHHPPW